MPFHRDPDHKAPFADHITRHVIGTERLLALSSPDSELARQQWRAPTHVPPHDAALLRAGVAAQERFEQWWETSVQGAKDDAIRRALSQMPLDLERVLSKVMTRETLTESELFIIKRFLYHALALLSRAGAGLDREDLEEDHATARAALATIHPEEEPSARFHLSGELDGELASARQALTAAKRAFMTRRKALVATKKRDYPGARFDLEGEVLLTGDLAIRAATDPELEPRAGVWRLRDEELAARRDEVDALTQKQDDLERALRHELGLALGEHVEWMIDLSESITRFDLRAARHRLRVVLGGSWPSVEQEGEATIMRGAHDPRWHMPEGDGQRVDFDFDDSPVVLTGPNMGGKSSLLKVVGLCQWCMQHRLPVPARAYSAPLVPHIVYVGSDERSEGGGAAGFSAFGREMRRVVEARASTTRGALWLLDEVCRGTHPADGAALASELIDTFRARGDRVLFATHFPELAAMEGVTRWRIAGLAHRERLLSLAERGLTAEELERALRESMDYRPIRLAPGTGDVPRDAHLIARLLGW